MKNNNQEFCYCKLSLFDETAFGEISSILISLLKLNQVINVALSGGNTPLPILEKLASLNIDWERISFYLVDERCVPVESRESNFGAISSIFFDKIPCKTFKMFDSLLGPKESSIRYENIIYKELPSNDFGIPVFDLLILGMGIDGHTASLFPKTKALSENERIVVSNDVIKLNSTRITFTYPLLMAANKRLMLVKGNDKIKVLTQLQKERLTTYPVDLIFRNSSMTWIVGQE